MTIVVKKVAAGFYIDMNMLLARYSSTKSVRFDDFAKYFREAKFSLIFCGRKDPREQRLLVEEMVAMVLRFWAPTTTFQERVFGLYMLYAIYSTQPVKPKVKVRLKVSHMAVVAQLLDLGGQDQHLDICYIINRLYLEKCFLYTASIRQMSPMMTNERDEDADPNMEVSAKVFNSMEMFGTSGSLLQLLHIHDQYVAMKASQLSESLRELTMVSENKFGDVGREISLLQAKYRAIQEGAEKSRQEAEDTSDEDYTEDIGARRTKLRQKLFRKAGNTRLKQRQDELLLQDDSSGNLVIDASGSNPAEGAKPAPKKRGRPRGKKGKKKDQLSTSAAADSVQLGGESDSGQD